MSTKQKRLVFPESVKFWPELFGYLYTKLLFRIAPLQLFFVMDRIVVEEG